ncbi:MAG: hypothetical protein SNJ75_08045 [Gemmataceae bacterium]
MGPFFVAGVLSALLVAGQATLWLLGRRHLDRWLGTYINEINKRKFPHQHEVIHLILCVADHYEPLFGNVPFTQGLKRVQHWWREYPRQFSCFRDSDGCTPRHTFFYPAEEYKKELLDPLAHLCSAGFGEVEIHLHHDNDTPENLRRTLSEFRDTLAVQHGLLARRPGGEAAYAFIHGNWALCNSRPDGRYCGVDNELAILQETGCYVDMTLPSAPSPTQTPIINRIYYAKDRPGPCAHHYPCTPGDGLMLIQGPLLLDWSKRKWGLLPGIENGCLQATQPPTLQRVRLWLKARVQMPQRPDWFFVKLHAHGAPEDAHEVLLGEPMVRFHEALAAQAARNPRFHYHYVTAREMYNLARAAEQGYSGSVADARNYELQPGPAMRKASGSPAELAKGLDGVRIGN